MKTLENINEKSSLVIRLERNQRVVGQLKNQLSSYIYEPRTYSLFEKFETLKNGLERFSASNRDIIEAISQTKKSVEEYMDTATQQFTVFDELQQRVQEYLLGARSY